MELRFDATHVALVESKFTERWTPWGREVSRKNAARYAAAFETYFDCPGTEFLPAPKPHTRPWAHRHQDSAIRCHDKPHTRAHLYQMAQRFLYVIENADASFAAIPHRLLLFLHYESHESLEAAKEFLALIREPFRSHAITMTYRELFRAMEAQFADDPHHAAWFEYMKGRYF